MVLPPERLSEYDFSLSDIIAERRETPERSFRTYRRSRNGFLYFTRGTFDFSSPEAAFRPSKDCMLYLPAGCRFTMTVTSPDYEYYRVSFKLYVDGEFTRFYDRPTLVTESVPPTWRDTILALERECRKENSSIVRMERLCALFTALGNAPRGSDTSRLEPAARYLRAHLTEPVDCSRLSALCYLGTAQFYSLFRAAYGMTPLEYRDKLLLRRAELLLESDELTVTEVGDALGFASSSYFSRFFHKHEGVSPSAYRRSRLRSLEQP